MINNTIKMDGKDFYFRVLTLLLIESNRIPIYPKKKYIYYRSTKIRVYGSAWS